MWTHEEAQALTVCTCLTVRARPGWGLLLPSSSRGLLLLPSVWLPSCGRSHRRPPSPGRRVRPASSLLAWYSASSGGADGLSLCRGHSSQRAVSCLSQWSLVCTRVALRHPDGSWEVRALPAPRDCPPRASSPLAPRVAWLWDAAIALHGAASPSPGPLVWESGPLVSARTTWVLWASLHSLTRPLAACPESCTAFTPET